MQGLDQLMSRKPRWQALQKNIHIKSMSHRSLLAQLLPASNPCSICRAIWLIFGTCGNGDFSG